MNDQDASSEAQQRRPPRRPEDLIGRRVRLGQDTGRVTEVDAVGDPHVVVHTRDGRLLRVPSSQWDELEFLP
jgi:hypothetical protein